MKTNHMQPIVTNARQGLALSTANRPRPRVIRGRVLLLAALALFWGCVAAALLA